MADKLAMFDNKLSLAMKHATRFVLKMSRSSFINWDVSTTWNGGEISDFPLKSPAQTYNFVGFDIVREEELNDPDEQMAKKNENANC